MPSHLLSYDHYSGYVLNSTSNNKSAGVSTPPVPSTASSMSSPSDSRMGVKRASSCISFFASLPSLYRLTCHISLYDTVLRGGNGNVNGTKGNNNDRHTAEQAIEAFAVKQNAALLDVIEREQTKESERQAIYARTNGDERSVLDTQYAVPDSYFSLTLLHIM
jgi:hypothetical protein